MARKASALRTELERAGISRQRLCEYRKLAAIPYPEFKKRLEDFKRNRKPITFRGIMRGEKEDPVIEEGQIKEEISPDGEAPQRGRSHLLRPAAPSASTHRE